MAMLHCPIMPWHLEVRNGISIPRHLHFDSFARRTLTRIDPTKAPHKAWRLAVPHNAC
jgi:hypothetical protein